MTIGIVKDLESDQVLVSQDLLFQQLGLPTAAVVKEVEWDYERRALMIVLSAGDLRRGEK